VRTRTLDEVLLMVKEKQGMSATRMKAQVGGGVVGAGVVGVGTAVSDRLGRGGVGWGAPEARLKAAKAQLSCT
jgi:hypothetical protein